MSPIDPEILGQLFDEHAPVLILYARQLCETPKDVVQEAFVSLARQRKIPYQVLPWLYRVVRNGAFAANRGEGRRRKREARASNVDDVWFGSTDDRIDARQARLLLAELYGSQKVQPQI